MVSHCMECGKKKGFMSVNYAGFNIKDNKYIHAFPERIKDLILPGNKNQDFLCADCASKRQVECSVHGIVSNGKFALGIPPTCKQCTEEKQIQRKQEQEMLATTKTASATVPEVVIDMPESQEKFVTLIQSFYQPYKNAPNDLKKSALRNERKVAIQNFLSNLNVKDWVGKLKTMSTNSEGKAYVEIQLENSNIVVKTWNNALSDMFDLTLIPSGTQLYNKISELSKGSRVRFSGVFKTKENDYLNESSLTENGAMTSPKFIMSFVDISIYVDPTE